MRGRPNSEWIWIRINWKRKLKKENVSGRKDGAERGSNAEREREREMQKEKWVIWVGSGLTGIQGWQHFGGGVWWFRSPPARGASVSGGGPDHELPHPPGATATNPFSPPPFTTSNHHPSNPKPAGRQRLAEAAAVYLIFWRNWNILLGERTCIHNYIAFTHRHTHAGMHGGIRSHTSPPQCINI